MVTVNLSTNGVLIQQEDDDTDPLDAFMADVNKEVKYLN